MRLMLLAIAGVLLFGCGRSVRIDNSTPDLALKSWWRLLDADDDYAYRECLQKSSESGGPVAVHQNEMLTGDALTVLSRGVTCVHRLYERTIDQVKMESDSRAWITATIKNVTPIPGDVHLSDSDRKERQSGDRFRYLLERDADGQPWKLSQSFRAFGVSDSDPDWTAEYDPKVKSSVMYTIVY